MVAVILVDDSPTGDLTHTHTATHPRDHIVTSGSPTEPLIKQTLAAADELVIPAAASAYSQDGLARTIEAYERAVGSYNPSLKLRGILVTRVKPTNAASAVFDEIGEAYGNLVIPQLIVESTAVDEAEQLNQPVVFYDPESKAAQGYKRVAEILTNG